MLHWDGGNAYDTCFVDYATGRAYVWAGRTEFIYDTLNPVAIQGFDNKKSYRVDFTMVGQTARCRVYENQQLVADTGDVVDPKAPSQGISGLMFELALEKAEVPLEGSFTELASTGL